MTTATQPTRFELFNGKLGPVWWEQWASEKETDRVRKFKWRAYRSSDSGKETIVASSGGEAVPEHKAHKSMRQLQDELTELEKWRR